MSVIAVKPRALDSRIPSRAKSLCSNALIHGYAANGFYFRAKQLRNWTAVSNEPRIARTLEYGGIFSQVRSKQTPLGISHKVWITRIRAAPCADWHPATLTAAAPIAARGGGENLVRIGRIFLTEIRRVHDERLLQLI